MSNVLDRTQACIILLQLKHACVLRFHLAVVALDREGAMLKCKVLHSIPRPLAAFLQDLHSSL
jgi:hypothetical protein